MNDALRSLLRELERFGADNDARASQHQQKMLNITPETGELLAILAQGMKARCVLEIGTSNGYSTLWLADAIRTGSGNVTTVDESAAKAEMARRNIGRAGLSAWVHQQIIEAGHFLRQQPPSRYDLLFLDSNRDQYVAYWPWIQRVLTSGGLLVVDNAVSHAEEMVEFIAQVQVAPGWRSVVVPIGHGVLMALKPMQLSGTVAADDG